MTGYWFFTWKVLLEVDKANWWPDIYFSYFSLLQKKCSKIYKYRNGLFTVWKAKVIFKSFDLIIICKYNVNQHPQQITKCCTKSHEWSWLSTFYSSCDATDRKHVDHTKCWIITFFFGGQLQPSALIEALPRPHGSECSSLVSRAGWVWVGCWGYCLRGGGGMRRGRGGPRQALCR